MNDGLFKSETKILARGKAALADEKAPDDGLREDFETLLKSYEKLFKETRRLVRLSDRNEIELRQAKDEAEAATRAKAAFLATMSHEIRTPMNGVVAMIDIMRQTRMDSDQRQMLGTIRESAFALLTIINDILDFSKIEAGKLDLENIGFSLRDTVEGVAETLSPGADEKGLRVIPFVDPRLPDNVVGDPVRLRQILLNLAGNAVKFTEAVADAADPDQNTVYVSAEAANGDTSADAAVRFQVVDRGIGMSPDTVEGLFQPFAQADSSTTRRFGGTGLGLSICKTLTDMMGGEISVTSEEGRGSTFTVELSFRADTEPAVPGPALDGLSVGVLTGSALLRDVLVRYLEHHGAQTAADTASGEADIVVAADDWESSVEGARSVVRLIGSGTSASEEGAHAVRARPLRRASLLNTVAAAAGRETIEDDREEAAATFTSIAAPSVEVAEAQGRLILVADDNPTNRDVISRQLKVLGYASETVDDGVEALTALETKDYALLLTDCHMPNLDGYQLTETIRQSEASNGSTRLPIIAVTANALASDGDKCLDAGMDGYLTKPMEMDRLKQELDRWLPHDAATVATGATEHGETAAAPDDGAPIDPGALTAMFGNDPAVFREILGDFVGPSEDILAEINSGFGQRSAGEVGKAAHKLKSSARSVGAHELADICEIMEKSGMVDDWTSIEDSMPRLESAWIAVRAYINAL